MMRLIFFPFVNIYQNFHGLFADIYQNFMVCSPNWVFWWHISEWCYVWLQTAVSYTVHRDFYGLWLVPFLFFLKSLTTCWRIFPCLYLKPTFRIDGSEEMLYLVSFSLMFWLVTLFSVCSLCLLKISNLQINWNKSYNILVTWQSQTMELAAGGGVL